MKRPRTPQRTTPAFGFSLVERALREGLADRHFGAAEQDAVLEFFGAHVCAYCGGPLQRWDHLVAVVNGGDTVLGNMVPACQPCDDSKQNRAFDEWMQSSAPRSPRSRGVAVQEIDRRAARLRAYVDRYRYTPRPWEERVTAVEREHLDELRSELNRVREGIDAFLAAYRAAR